MFSSLRNRRNLVKFNFLDSGERFKRLLLLCLWQTRCPLKKIPSQMVVAMKPTNSADVAEHVLRASDSHEVDDTADKESEVVEHLKMFAKPSRISKAFSSGGTVNNKVLLKTS